MALKIERVAGGWRTHDPDNSAVDVTHRDRIAALELAQAALAQNKQEATRNEARSAPIPEYRAVKPIPVKQVTLEAVLSRQERPYLSTADELLARHCLDVPDYVRLMLARTIAHAHLPQPLEETHTPIPALRRARTHAQKLIGYSEHPPARKSSVKTRCVSLHAALSNDVAAFGIGVASLKYKNALDYGSVLAGLANGSINARALEVLTDLINDELLRQESWRLGRPQTYGRIIKESCITWRRAGREGGFSQHASLGDEKLIGLLPAFIRDYFGCCGIDIPSDAALHREIIQHIKHPA